jgi:uncharacterized protein YggE
MTRIRALGLLLATGFLWNSPRAVGQTGDMKFIADTLVVQADGSYEADPDVATVIFDITSQDKDLKQTYDRAAGSMQKIISLAEKNGLRKEDISSGVLTVTPYYEGDRKKERNLMVCEGNLRCAFTISPNSARYWRDQ